VVNKRFSTPQTHLQMAYHQHVQIFTDAETVCKRVAELCHALPGETEYEVSCAAFSDDPEETPEERACKHINVTNMCRGAAVYTCVCLASAIAGDFHTTMHKPQCQLQCGQCAAFDHTTTSMARMIRGASGQHRTNPPPDREVLVIIPTTRRLVERGTTVQVTLAAFLVSIYGMEVPPAPQPNPVAGTAALALLLAVIILAGYLVTLEGTAERVARVLEADEYAFVFVIGVCAALGVFYVGFLCWVQRAQLLQCFRREEEPDADAGLFSSDLPVTPLRRATPECE